MPVFTGSGVAVVTPFDENNKLNGAVLEQLVDFHVDGGTDAIIVCGTTGESATMTDDEQAEAIRICVSRSAGRIPIVAGTGTNCTHHSIERSKRAQALGADALLLVTPYYNKATQKGLIAHFEAIAASVDLPIILYNVPSRTTVNILPETLLELSRVSNITGVKEACGDINQISRLAALVEGKMDIYGGNDDHILPVLSVGGIGVISVLANVAPRATHDIVMKFLEGDLAGSRRIQLDVMELVGALFSEVNPIPVKRGVELLGFNVGRCRMPLSVLEPAGEERLVAAMKGFGLLKEGRQ